MITISHVEESAYDELKEFGRQEWPAADREHFGTDEVDFERKNFAFKAMADGEMVGYIKMIFDMGVTHLDSLLVSEKHRGQGIAKQLLQAGEKAARSRSAHRIWLETGSDWHARKFYESQGYSVMAELPNHYANRDFVIMGKDL